MVSTGNKWSNWGRRVSELFHLKKNGGDPENNSEFGAGAGVVKKKKEMSSELEWSGGIPWYLGVGVLLIQNWGWAKSPPLSLSLSLSLSPSLSLSLSLFQVELRQATVRSSLVM